MKRSAIVFGAAAAVITASAVYAADAGVTNAYFEINGASVHELNGSSVNCNIKTDGKEGSAVMLCAVYDKTSNALKSMKVVSGANGSYSENVSISDADNSYVTMCLWNSMAGGRPISQVYALYPKDPAPENPWKVNEDTTGAITFSWEECEDNLKTAGYKVYKNGTMVQNSNSLSYTDFEEKWYSAKENEYKITAYDEYGNESSGTEFKNVAIDKTNMAAVHFMAPEKSEKMSLYLATNKENDPSWYGYNTADNIGGEECRRIPTDKRAVFKLSDDFKKLTGSEARNAIIRVTYFDNGNDYFKMSYVGVGNRYTNLEVKKNNTNQWITKDFTVNDFSNASSEGKVQDENVDFSIWCKSDSDKGSVVDTDTYIGEIQILLDGKEIVQPTPTPEPTATPEPGVEPIGNISRDNQSTTDKLVLTWSKPSVTGAIAKYNIYRNDVLIGSSENETYTDNNVTWEKYNYRIEAVDADGKKLAEGSAELRVDMTNFAAIKLCSNDNSAAESYIGGKMAIFWGKNDGQFGKDGWYGYNTGAVKDGVECRRIGNESNGKRIAFTFDDEFVNEIGTGERNAVIRIKYYDEGSDSIRVSYVSKKNRYKNLEIKKTDTKTWKWAELEVNDMVTEAEDENNGVHIQDESTWFSIWSKFGNESNDKNTADYIAEVQIRLKDDNEPTAEPTVKPSTEPAPSSKPTAEPTAKPSTEPTVKPSTEPTEVPAANKASIVLKNDSTSAESSYTGTHMSIYWGPDNKHLNNTGWYAYNTGDERNGVECRKIEGGAGKRIVFMFDDAFVNEIGTEGRNAVIRVKYYDEGSDSVRVSYVSRTKRYKNLEIKKTDTKEWKWAEFNVDDLSAEADDADSKGIHIQDESTWFSIWSKFDKETNETNTADYIAEVQIELKDEPEPTAEPTTEPTAEPTAKPTTEPTAEPTTEPTAKPTTEPTANPTTEPTAAPTEEPIEDVNKASIVLKNDSTSAESSYTGTHMSVFWGPDNKHLNNTGWYAYNTGDEKDGVECRKIEGGAGKRIVFMFDDAFVNEIGTEGRNAVIKVKYYDEGSDSVRVSYVSRTKRYKNLEIKKTDTKEWKWAEFDVDDLSAEADDADSKGIHIQDESTWFSIWSKFDKETNETNTADYIAEVQIELKDEPEPTTEPTAEPTTEPTAEPTAEPTTEPTAEPTTEPTTEPTAEPTTEPTAEPTTEPTAEPTTEPTAEPTTEPSEDSESASVVLHNDSTSAENSYTGTHMSVFWGPDNKHLNNTGWYAYNTGDEKDGVECRKIEGGAGKRIVFMFDDAFVNEIGTEGRNAVIKVKYYDEGSDSVRVSYVSRTKRYKNLEIKKTDTKEWKWAEFDVDDLSAEADDADSKGIHIQDESTWFSIWSKFGSEANDVNTADYIAEVKVELK